MQLLSVFRSYLALKVPPVLVVLAVATAMVLSPSFIVWASAGGVVLGACLAMLGALVCVAGVGAFRRARTTVSPVAPQRTSVLVVHGVYRYSRNPMYLGFALALLGLAVGLGSLSAVLWWGLAVAYLQHFQIVPEEQVLHAKFGPAYSAYTLQVGRWWGRRPRTHVGG